MKRGTTHLKQLPARTEQRKDRLLLLNDVKCESILHDPLLEVAITIFVRIGERDQWVDSEWTGSLETLHEHLQASSGVYPAARLLRPDVSWYQQGEIEERHLSTG